MRHYFLLFVLFSSFLMMAQRPDAANKKEWKAFFEEGVERKIDCSNKDLENAIELAQQYLGTPHCMGGTSKQCIDCSGLMYVVFNEVKVKLEGRTAQDFALYGKLELNQDKLERGNLVFFTNTYNSKDLVTHVGLVLGDGMFIHTSASKGVMISNYLEPGYWQSHFIFGTKL